MNKNAWKKHSGNRFWTIFVILLVLWAMGLLTGYTLVGVLHALLVIAVLVILLRVIQSRSL